MGAKNKVGIGVLYLPARLLRLARRYNNSVYCPDGFFLSVARGGRGRGCKDRLGNTN
jgi:hypothetical protein